MRVRGDSTFVINGIVVDLNDETVHDGLGAPIALRPQAFAVLRYLVEHPRRIVSRDELMDAVWSGLAVTDDSLVQCIHEIRRALRDNDRAIIRTVPRRGYRLLPEDSGAGRRRAGRSSAWVLPAGLAALLVASVAGVGLLAWSATTGDRATIAKLPFGDLTVVGQDYLGRGVAATPGDPAATAATADPQAVAAYNLGRRLAERHTPDDASEARLHFERAMALDPSYAAPRAAMAKLYAQVETVRDSRALAINLFDAAARASQALAPLAGRATPSADSHVVESWLALKVHQHKRAVIEGELAVELAPDDADAIEALTRARIFAGMADSGLELAEELAGRHPDMLDRARLLQGLARFALDRPEAAIETLAPAFDDGAQDFIYAGILAAAHGVLRHRAEARAAWRKFEQAFAETPDLARAMAVFPFADHAVMARLADGLEVAGAKVWFSREDGGYLPLYAANRANRAELATLFFARHIEGRGLGCSGTWQRSVAADGRVEYAGSPVYGDVPDTTIRLSRIKDDMICERWPSGPGSEERCAVVYRLPTANARKRWGDYVLMTAAGPHPFWLAN